MPKERFNPGRITLLRQAKGMTQQELADATEITRQFVQMIETAKAAPSLETLEKLADALDTSPSFFFATAAREEATAS